MEGEGEEKNKSNEAEGFKFHLQLKVALLEGALFMQNLFIDFV